MMVLAMGPEYQVDLLFLMDKRKLAKRREQKIVNKIAFLLIMITKKN